MTSRLRRREFLERSVRVLAGLGAVGMLDSCNSVQGGSKASRVPGLIDTHVHFYDPARPQGVPWPPKDERLLYRTVLPGHYASQPQPQPVTGVVVVEASPWVEDNQWVLDLALREPLIVGMVGSLPFGAPEFQSQLKRFAGNRLFRGLRIRPAPARDRWAAPDYLGNLKCLADHDLSLDLVGGLEILEWAPAIAKAFPSLRIVIDHLAGVRVDGNPPSSAWLQAMRGLVKHAGIFVKVSGLVEGSGGGGSRASRETEFYRPVLDAVWTMFGEDRLIYGSNWPVCELFADLFTVQRIAADYFAAKGARVRDRVFAENAERAYRWVKRNP